MPAGLSAVGGDDIADEVGRGIHDAAGIAIDNLEWTARCCPVWPAAPAPLEPGLGRSAFRGGRPCFFIACVLQHSAAIP